MAKTLQTLVDEALKVVPEIDADRAQTLISEMDTTILDVREPDEFAGGHLPGAINIPRGILEVAADHQHAMHDERIWDRRKRILCYCASGFRSALAAKTLQDMGFKEAISMRGGWNAWTERKKPVE